MGTISPIPLPEFRQQLAKLYTASGRAAKTRKQIDHALRLAEAAGVESTAGLTTMAMAEVVSRRGPRANPNTTRGLLSRLRRASNLAVRLRLLDRDEAPDWASLWPRATPSVRNLPHTAEEVARLLESLATRAGTGWYAGRLHALAALVSYTGLRRNEALHLRREDLDLDRGFLFVSARARLKTVGSAAPVPVPDALAEVLRAWLPRCGRWVFPGARREGPWVGGSPGYRPVDRLRQAGIAASVPGVGFHSLRHTLATQLLREGVPVWAIQRMLRHGTPLATACYLHPQDHDVAGFVRGFEYRVG